MDESIEVARPGVHDRRPPDQRESFTSKILPLYLRKAKAIEELIPWLYLKAVSTPGGGDFQEALQAVLGPSCPGLSASTVTRVKQTWEGGIPPLVAAGPLGRTLRLPLD